MSGKDPRERPGHEIILVSSPEEKQQCFDVRMMVFHLEQQNPIEVEKDVHDSDPNTAYLLLRLTPSLVPIGTIRAVKIVESGSTYYKLGRLAVLKEYRNFAFGRALVHAFHDWVRADALKELPLGWDPAASTAIITCSSQIPAKGFYASLGYIEKGSKYDDCGRPHQQMIFQLPLEL